MANFMLLLNALVDSALCICVDLQGKVTCLGNNQLLPFLFFEVIMLTSRTPASPTPSIQNQTCVDMCKGQHCLVPGSCSGNTRSSPLRAKGPGGQQVVGRD